MARRRRMTRVTRISQRTDRPASDSDPEAQLDRLLVDVLEPVSAAEEEEEEQDLIMVRRALAESVGAPVSVCSTLFLHGRDLLFERSNPEHPLVLGRHESSDVVIPDNSVSRRHAELEYRDDAWFIRDLDSKSGTLVNGETLSGVVRLKEGDRVKLGKVSLGISFSMPTSIEDDEEVEEEPAGRTPANAEEKADASAGPDETPVVADELPRSESAAAPAIQGAASERPSERLRLGRSPKSGRAEVKKRQIDIQDRREAENIKTIGILGAVVIAAFVIYGIVSSLQNQPAPNPTMSGHGTPPVKAPSAKDAEHAADETATPAGETATQVPDAAAEHAPPAEVSEQVTTQSAAQTLEQDGQATETVEGTARTTADTQTTAGNGPETAPADAPPAAAVDRLPDLPEPILAEVSPFEPRWFAGPGEAMVVTEGGETVNGSFLIKGDTVHVDSAGVATTMKLVDVKELVWSGASLFAEADGLLRKGQYSQAAEKYAETVRSSEEALRGQGADPTTFAGRWYAEGRRRECLLKADHLRFCQAVFAQPDLASAEQLNAAGNSFVQVGTAGCAAAELRPKFEALLAAGKIELDAAARDRWEDLKQPCGPKKVEVAQEKPLPPAETATAETIVPQEPPTASRVLPGVVPAIQPQLLALTCIGGAGDQYIHEVGFLPDGTIYGKGTGFMVGYSKDGAKCLGITGNPATPGKERRGANWANKGTDLVVEGVKLTIGYRQVHAILQQPYIDSSAGWRWWGWSHDEAKKRELMADSRGVALLAMPEGRFLAKCWCDGGNTVLEKDPRNLDQGNAALANAYNRCAAGSASLYIVGDVKTGEPLCATWMIHRPQSEAVDAYGRIYISQQAAKKYGSAHKDSLGLGGKAGFSIFNPTLSECLFSGSLGGDETYSLAVHGNLLVIGGSVGQARKGKDGAAKPPETDPERLPLKNPAQPKPGGGEDGFLAIFRLWPST